jgi:hypothetical protein
LGWASGMGLVGFGVGGYGQGSVIKQILSTSMIIFVFGVHVSHWYDAFLFSLKLVFHVDSLNISHPAYHLVDFHILVCVSAIFDVKICY